MTEGEFLENISYSKDNNFFIVWYNKDVIHEEDFTDNPEMLKNKGFCKDLMFSIALGSETAKKLVNE